MGMERLGWRAALAIQGNVLAWLTIRRMPICPAEQQQLRAGRPERRLGCVLTMTFVDASLVLPAVTCLCLPRQLMLVALAGGLTVCRASQG